MGFCMADSVIMRGKYDGFQTLCFSAVAVGYSISGANFSERMFRVEIRT